MKKDKDEAKPDTIDKVAEAQKLLNEHKAAKRKACIEEASSVYAKYGFTLEVHHPEPVLYLKETQK